MTSIEFKSAILVEFTDFRIIQMSAEEFKELQVTENDYRNFRRIQ